MDTMKLDFYRFRDEKHYTADLVVFIDGEQRVIGTYRVRKTPDLTLKWHISFAEGDDPETVIGGAWTLAEAKKGASANAARRVHALKTSK